MHAHDPALRPWRCLGMLVLLVALLVMLPRLAADGLANAGSLALARAALLLEEDGPGEQHTRMLERAGARFEQALALNGDHSAARWGLARVFLVRDKLGIEAGRDPALAVDALRPLVVEGIRNPLLYRDALVTFSHRGRPEDVIGLYESGLPLERTRSVSDTVALAYLQRGAPDDLARVRELRPGDICANYHLWRAARDAGDAGTAAACGEALSCFPLEAVHPTDERLLDHAVRVIPPLLEEGWWDRDRALNVVSFLVWQHSEATSVEWLLDQIIERYPTEFDWLFYLAEFYHRRGDLDRAEATYRQALDVDPERAQAYMRLGMVAETKSQVPSPKSQEQLEEAGWWYEQYNEMTPDDLLGLRKLTQVYEALGRPEATVLREELAARTDDMRIVTELLGVPVEDVELGPNLVENGGIEVWEKERQPDGWRWLTWAGGKKRSPALFVGGFDELDAIEGRRAMRVDGFWLQAKPELELARAGYRVGEIQLRPDTLYVLSFCYRTRDSGKEKSAIWVTADPDVLFQHDHMLPPTNDAWRKFIITGWSNAVEPNQIAPLLRSWGAGQVEFDGIRLSGITLATSVQIEDRLTRFELR